jgi:ribosomal protein S18 acetylase RimI-like enzyme
VNVCIRNLLSEDYGVLLQLWKEADFTIGKSDSEEEYVRFLQQNPNTSLCIVQNDQLIGAVMGGFDGRRGMIHHLVVSREFRSHGYGKLLMDELMRRFKSMGVVKVSLWVKTDNEGVIDFYRSVGFDLRMDLYTMSCLL